MTSLLGAGPMQRSRPSDAPTHSRRSTAGQKALDRRAKRSGVSSDSQQSWSRRSASRKATEASAPVVARPTLRERIADVPFVVPVVALIVAGMAATLWLSTKSAQDSYDLSAARAQNQTLVDQRDALKKRFESADAAPDLSDKAAQLGMVPARNPARMVVGADGRPHVLGTPTAVTGRAPGSINPPQRDDPTAKIDVSKVDDSKGLPGSDEDGAAQGSAQQGPVPTPTDGSATLTPAPTAPGDAPPTNVLPNGGAPTANSVPNR